jgi:hypothetical protein
MPRKKAAEVATTEEVAVADPQDEVAASELSVESIAAELAALKQQNVDLLSALMASRTMHRQVIQDLEGYPSVEDASIDILWGGGSSVHLRITDKFGRDKWIMIDRDTPSYTVTQSQYEEIVEDVPQFFSQGLIRLAGEDNNPNVITDLDGWIADLDIERTHEQLGQIDSEATLSRIFDHLESKRIRTEDATGRTLLDDEGNVTAKVVPLSAREALVLSEVRQRLFALSGVNYSEND